MSQNAYPPQYEHWPQSGGPGGGYTPNPPPPPRRMKVLWIIFGVMAVITVGLCLIVGLSIDNSKKPTDVPRTTAIATTAAQTHPTAKAVPVKPTVVVVGDGSWEVGTEIKPGTYTTTVGLNTGGCYWARLRNFDGGLDSIIDNGNYDPGAHGRIVVKSSDKGVELTGGCAWMKIK